MSSSLSEGPIIADLLEELEFSLKILEPIIEANVNALEISQDMLAKSNADLIHLETMHAEHEKGLEKFESAVDALLNEDLATTVLANSFNEEEHKIRMQKWNSEIVAINKKKEEYDNKYFEMQEQMTNLKQRINEKRQQIAEKEEKNRKDKEEEARRLEEESKRGEVELNRQEELQKRKKELEKEMREREAGELEKIARNYRRCRSNARTPMKTPTKQTPPSTKVTPSRSKRASADAALTRTPVNKRQSPCTVQTIKRKASSTGADNEPAVGPTTTSKQQNTLVNEVQKCNKRAVVYYTSNDDKTMETDDGGFDDTFWRD